MKKTFIILISLAGLIVIVLSIAIFRTNKQEEQSRKLLTTELVRIGVPSNCSETERHYNTGGLDVSGGWNVEYTCNTKGLEFFNDLNKRIVPLGYNVPGEPSNYLVSRNNNFTVTYSNTSPGELTYPSNWTTLNETQKSEAIKSMSEEQHISSTELIITRN